MSFKAHVEGFRSCSGRSPTEKTIEGDLFAAFVAAGAISKANADDPQKSSLVRCARTDKGVHAAGNVISLKLIVEDPDVVRKINEQLSPQIRVWEIERTNGGFSAYQFCDSRKYEYLIPTYCFLPPHPQSFLGRNILELASEAGDIEGYNSRQKDALNYWSGQEAVLLRALFKDTDEGLARKILKIFHESGSVPDNIDSEELRELHDFARDIDFDGKDSEKSDHPADANMLASFEEDDLAAPHRLQRESGPLDCLLRHLRSLEIKAKKAYRIHPDRLAIVGSTLSRFVGSHNFHNYTIDKDYRDRSAMRVMKSFVVSGNPLIIDDTEWLSLKVHGQSFMMHQIRKMVSMTALSVRCGCHEGRMQDTYLPDRLSIPKAPSLGLLLEEPVFEAYNKKLEDFGRARIGFDKFKKEIDEFKQREIYGRIFREERDFNTFHNFFAGLDHTRSSQLFFLSSVGLEARKRTVSAGSATGVATATADGGNAEASSGVEKGARQSLLQSVDEVASEDEEGHNEGS